MKRYSGQLLSVHQQISVHGSLCRAFCIRRALSSIAALGIISFDYVCLTITIDEKLLGAAFISTSIDCSTSQLLDIGSLCERMLCYVHHAFISFLPNNSFCCRLLVLKSCIGVFSTPLTEQLVVFDESFEQSWLYHIPSLRECIYNSFC